MRLFVAIDLDDVARAAIAQTQRRLAEILDTDRSLKWVSPAHMHLTLAFLGEIAEPVVPAIVENLSLNIDARPFTAVFRNLGVFPPRGAPRVLWLGVGDGASDVVGAQRVVADRVADAGVALDRRPFHPHLTLARWRSSRPKDARRALAVGPETPTARVDVDHVTLYQSRLTSAGPVYTSLARATLT
jgi:RNA 2',3'-cyclic 3'-phosphodiesterase